MSIIVVQGIEDGDKNSKKAKLNAFQSYQLLIRKKIKLFIRTYIIINHFQQASWTLPFFSPYPMTID